MDYKKEIIYRKELLNKAIEGQKLTTEERQWLAVHKSYNSLLGHPYLNTDILEIEPKTKYNIQIFWEEATHYSNILPVFYVPAKKGSIIGYDLRDYEGRLKPGRSVVKILGLTVNPKNKDAQFEYFSELGLLGVCFQCDYYDDKQKLQIRQNSNTGYSGLAMLREELGKNTMRYRCKAPNHDQFDSLVFSIQWNSMA